MDDGNVNPVYFGLIDIKLGMSSWIVRLLLVHMKFNTFNADGLRLMDFEK